jgi:hypothetical protein
VSLATSFPAITDSLELLRRGLITSDQFYAWSSLNSVPLEVAAILIKLRELPVSVADAALAVLRGNLTKAQGEAIASQNGYSAASFETIINNTGEPPGAEQLLEAYRRGIISKATLERGILQSRYRNEWIPTIEALRYSPMSTADAVDAVIQNHLTASQAAKIADENGLDPGSVTTLIETAGSPLSRTEMSDLYNRGLATQVEFDQALNESRLKPKYTAHAFQLRTRIPQVGELSAALLDGTITQHEAVAKIVELGYSAADATLLASAGIASRTKAYRDKVVASIETLYHDGIISQADATSGITSMGFDATEASLIVKSADFRREATVITAAVRGVRTKYLGHHVTANQAIGYLNKIGLPSAQVEYLMRVWEIEAGAFTKLLTEAQIIKGMKGNLITPQDAESRLIALGYTQGDADLLLNGA